MTRPPLANLRNIGIISHIDAGKTTVSERILFYTDAIHQMGEVHDGAAVMDWMEQERERGITITATATTCHWQGSEITLIDTPGHIDFTVEVERSLRVLDGAVVIFSAVEGVQPQSESVWRQADRYRVPRICLINKLDRIGADPQMVMTQLRDRLGAHPIPVQLPCGEESAFNGIIDLIDQRLLSFSDKDLGRTITAEAVPTELTAAVAAARNLLIETAADFDDTILEDYLDNRPIVAERLRAALRIGTIRGAICPLFFAAALRNKGIQPLLDGINAYLPSPLDLPPLQARRLDRDEVVTLESDPRLPLCALAFKVVADEGRKLAYVRIYSGTIRPGDLLATPRCGGSERVGRLFRMHAHRREPLEAAGAGEIVAITGLRQVLTGDTLCAPGHPWRLDGLTLPESVVSLAIEAKGVEDRERSAAALEKLQWEDPTFRVHEDPETGQTILTGMGELHLEVMLERLRREYGVQVASGPPQVVYRETIATEIERREIYQREQDGKSQYGDVLLRLVPLPRGEGLHLVGPPENGLPSELREHLVATLRQGCECGPLAGYPLTDLSVAIVEAPFLPGTTTEIGLRAALQRGLSLALRAAAPLLLEPVMAVELTVPTDAAGRVLAIVQQKRGKIEGMTVRDSNEVLQAEAPLIELFGFMTELRSASKGRGSFSMTFSHYAPAPPESLQRLGLLRKDPHI